MSFPIQEKISIDCQDGRWELTKVKTIKSSSQASIYLCRVESAPELNGKRIGETIVLKKAYGENAKKLRKALALIGELGLSRFFAHIITSAYGKELEKNFSILMPHYSMDGFTYITEGWKTEQMTIHQKLLRFILKSHKAFYPRAIYHDVKPENILVEGDSIVWCDHESLTTFPPSQICVTPSYLPLQDAFLPMVKNSSRFLWGKTPKSKTIRSATFTWDLLLHQVGHFALIILLGFSTHSYAILQSLKERKVGIFFLEDLKALPWWSNSWNEAARLSPFLLTPNDGVSKERMKEIEAIVEVRFAEIVKKALVYDLDRGRDFLGEEVHLVWKDFVEQCFAASESKEVWKTLLGHPFFSLNLNPVREDGEERPPSPSKRKKETTTHLVTREMEKDQRALSL